MLYGAIVVGLLAFVLVIVSWATHWYGIQSPCSSFFFTLLPSSFFLSTLYSSSLVKCDRRGSGHCVSGVESSFSPLFLRFLSPLSSLLHSLSFSSILHIGGQYLQTRWLCPIHRPSIHPSLPYLSLPPLLFSPLYIFYLFYLTEQRN